MMIYWNYIVIGLSLALLVLLLWKEVSRRNRAWVKSRFVSTVLAVSSLACIALPIHIKQQSTVDSSKEPILLTEGFNEDSVSTFTKQKQAAVPTYYLQEEIKNDVPSNTIYTPGISGIINGKDKFNALHVFGYGLSKEELAHLNGLPIMFHPSELKTGITSINWNKKIKTGDNLYVQGNFKNGTAKDVKMILSAFNTNLDSLNIKANTSNKFQLITMPKQTGRAVYTLTILSGKDTLQKEPIPFEVEATQSLKVLMLAAYPDFENKFLKNWLAQNGYVVAKRTTISKDKFSKEYLNITSFAMDRLQAAVLDKFDVLITDAAAFSALSKTEQNAIQNYVEQKGLGLIVKADSTLVGAAFFKRSFPLSMVTNLNQSTVKLHVSDSASGFPALTIEQPLYINNQSSSKPLVFDQQSHVYAAVTIFGAGRTLLTTLTNTYQWMLSANNEAYQSLWSTLIDNVVSKKPAKETWSTSPAFARVNEPVQLRVETTRDSIPVGRVEDNNVYLQQSAQLPSQWSGTYWPLKEGWQQGLQSDGAAYWFFVYGNDGFKSVRAMETIDITAKYALQHPYLRNKYNVASSTISIEFPKIWFFIIFVLSCGFLWLERKFL